MKRDVSKSIKPLSDAFLEGIKSILGNKLYGAYVYGAVTFPDSGRLGDFDAHVILTEPLTEQEKTGINEMFDRFERDFPPLGVGMDVHFILLEEAQGTGHPKHQVVEGVWDTSWALHRAHMRAGRVIILYGPDPVDAFPEPEWSELERDLDSELDYVERHLEKYPDYCVLNLCRLMYSYENRDVVASKAGSAEWIKSKFPEWSYLIDIALKSYAREATEKDFEIMKSTLPDFYSFALEKINQHR